MPFATRHRNDPMPSLSPLDALEVHHVWDVAFMAGLQQRSEAEIAQRFADGHRPYVAWHAETPAAFGWVATRTASIGELGATFNTGEQKRDHAAWHVDMLGLRCGLVCAWHERR